MSSAVRWHRSIPEAICALDTLGAPDYTDIVTARVSKTSGRTPEQWLRAMVDGVPRSLVPVVPTIQRVVLGLRLQMRPSPDYVVGWKIAGRGADYVRIEASWFLTGHVIVHVYDGQLSFATFIRYDRPLAALVWPPVSLIHRQVALVLVRSAARAQ